MFFGSAPKSRFGAALIRWGTALALVAGAFGSTAIAQDTGFYVERFEPMPAQGINLLNLGTSEVLGHMLPSVGLTLQYIDDPLEIIEEATGDVLSRAVERQIKADIWASFGFANVVDIGIALPFTLNQSGQGLQRIPANVGDTISEFALGDIRLIPKVRLINQADAGGFGLALLVNVSLPTGSQDDFASDGAVRVEPRLVLDWTHADSGFSIVGNVGYHLRPGLKVHNLVIDDELTWGAGLRIPTPAEQLKLVATVHGAYPIEETKNPLTGNASGRERSFPVEVDGAAELTMGDFVGNAGAGFGLTKGFGAPDFRIFLSFGYVPRCVDNDGDGICNRNDGPDGACKNDPEDFDGYRDSDGCPDPDNDEDGVPDISDGDKDSSGYGKCRNNPEDKDGFEDADGCPDPDNDKDGVLDVNDGEDDPAFPGFGLCRNDPEDMDGFEDSDGCPDPDNDKDGVLDKDDGEADASGYGRCRNDPEDVDGFEDDDGCPDPDNDGDGTLDVDDGPPNDRNFPNFGICRDSPGPTAEELAERGVKPPYKYPGAYPGCDYVIAPKEPSCGEFIITDKVHFAYNRAKIKKQSFPLLDAVAKVMTEHPWATLIRVEGHTDWHGSTAYNEKLSDRRADAVRRYVVKKGVATKRLVKKGYGKAYPISNDERGVCERCTENCACKPNDDEVRALNRRVQFRILEVNGAPCPVTY